MKIPQTLLNSSMFQGVVFTNLTFGKPTLDPEDPKFWEKLDSQANLVEEELKELRAAIKTKNLKELRDGVADVLVTALGVDHLAGFDADDDMRQVLISNLSKVSATPEDAAATHDFYLDEKGVNTITEPCKTMPGFIVKVDGDQTGSDGKFYPDRKFLKCVKNFREPQFFWPAE